MIWPVMPEIQDLVSLKFIIPPHEKKNLNK